MDEEIRRLHGDGWRDPQIAEAVGHSISWVNRRRHALGLATHAPHRGTRRFPDAKARRLYDEGLVDRDVAQRIRMSRESVQKWRAANGLPPNGWSTIKDS